MHRRRYPRRRHSPVTLGLKLILAATVAITALQTSSQTTRITTPETTTHTPARTAQHMPPNSLHNAIASAMCTVSRSARGTAAAVGENLPALLAPRLATQYLLAVERHTCTQHIGPAAPTTTQHRSPSLLFKRETQ